MLKIYMCINANLYIDFMKPFVTCCCLDRSCILIFMYLEFLCVCAVLCY